MRHAASFCLGLAALVAVPASARAEEEPVPIGVAVVDITPETPIRLTGYGDRKTKSEGVSS
jgi:neutral ceramidase